MSVRDTAAQFGLEEIKRSEVTIFQSREDYRKHEGLEAPPYNPALPNKYWAWTTLGVTRVVTALFPELIGGAPVLLPLSLPLSYAQSVNIPPGEANAERVYATDTLLFPVEPLRADEYLALGFGETIVVRNRTRFVEPVQRFEERVLAALDLIKAKLGI